jgi:hypothetical protein
MRFAFSRSVGDAARRTIEKDCAAEANPNLPSKFAPYCWTQSLHDFVIVNYQKENW